MHQPLLDALPLQFIAVRHAEFVVWLPTGKDGIDHHQNGMSQRDQCSLLPAPRRNPPLLRRQVGVFRLGGHVRNLDQHLPEPDIALPGFAAQPFAAALLVARTHSCP